MFLQVKFFKSKLFKPFYKRFRNSLENKGIVLFKLEDSVQEIQEIHMKKQNNLILEKQLNQDINISQKNNNENKNKNENKNENENENENKNEDKNEDEIKTDSTNLTFDDCPYPNPNVLYIHLFNGKYYNDLIYSKKKLSNEREMLFLLAGKLGVKLITYTTEIVESKITRCEGSIKIKGFKNGIKYNKTVQKKTETSGEESYLNRGAPVYVQSNNIAEVEKDIKKNLGSLQSNVFNYDFYKNNQKLESFVYKRFEFKMLNLKYTLESEDTSDISFSVKSSFADFGLNLDFEKINTFTETVNYVLEFFPDNELKMQYFTNKKMQADPFYVIKEQYNAVEDKELAVQYVIEYVTKLVKQCFYKVRNGCGAQYDYSKRLLDYIKNNEEGTFETQCKKFQSSLQIKNWIYKTLSNNCDEIVNEEDNATFGKKKLGRGDTVKNNGEMHGFYTSANQEQMQSNISGESNNSEMHGYVTSPRSNVINNKRRMDITQNESQNNSQENISSENISQENISQENISQENISQENNSQENSDKSNNLNNLNNSTRSQISIQSQASPKNSPNMPRRTSFTNANIMSPSIMSPSIMSPSIISPRRRSSSTTKLVNYNENNQVLLLESIPQNKEDEEELIEDLIKAYSLINKKIEDSKVIIERTKEDYELIKNKNLSLISVEQIELDMYVSKISSLERKILNEEMKFNEKIKNSKPNEDAKISNKKKDLKKQQFENENSLHTQLRDSKLERNKLLYKIKEIENDTLSKLKQLQDLQSEYDEYIIKKNNLEEHFSNFGIQI